MGIPTFSGSESGGLLPVVVAAKGADEDGAVVAGTLLFVLDEVAPWGIFSGGNDGAAADASPLPARVPPPPPCTARGAASWSSMVAGGRLE